MLHWVLPVPYCICIFTKRQNKILHMSKAQWQKFMRKSHRYLGVFFGIQFLFWTIGGLYFSWTNIKSIRGEDVKKEEAPIKLNTLSEPLQGIFNQIRLSDSVLTIKSIHIISLFGEPHYQISFYNKERLKTVLVHLQTNKLRDALSKEEAILVAKNSLTKKANFEGIEFITSTNGHHEYRGKPLPAYAIKFVGPIHTTVYVSAELGTVQTYRNNQWRIFDFLWMLHVMDYQNRDNINNWILRAFSILGLITIASGFILYFLTYKKLKSNRIDSK